MRLRTNKEIESGREKKMMEFSNLWKYPKVNFTNHIGDSNSFFAVVQVGQQPSKEGKYREHHRSATKLCYQ